MQNRILKSIISVILCISILFSLASYFAVSAATQSGYITDLDTPTRVRITPTSKISTNILKDSKGLNVVLGSRHEVTVLETVSSDGDSSIPKWCHIEFTYNGKKYDGYVNAEWVVIKTTTDDYEMPEGVPEIYKEYVEELLKLHPNWNFVFYDTKLEWKDVISTDIQGALGRNVIYYTLPYSYRSTQSGAFNWREDKWLNPDNETGWYQASPQTIAYYMDPRNFLNESNIFMFEALSYDSKTQTLDGVQKILKGSFMDSVNIKNIDNKDVSYAQAYIDAGIKANVSPYHLASRTVQEVGKQGSGSTSGKYIAKNGTNYSGYYNFYNIGASAGSDPIANGLRYASGKDSNGNSLSQTTLNSYMLPWNSQYKAIVGGAKWIGNGYINNKQDTLYYQKFNVVNQVWWHQYMANISAPYSESISIKKTYSDLEILDNSFTFLIPYYRNMPAKACQLPEANNYNPNNWLKTLKIEDYDFGFDSGKTSGYTIEVPSSVSSVNISAASINSNAKISGTGKVDLKAGSNAVEIQVTAENGNKRTYVVNIIRNANNIVPLTGISLNSTSLSMFTGDTKKLTVTYKPSNATDSKTVTWSTSDKSVATVSNGTITAIGVGTATITAKVGAFTATCKVTVSSSTNYTLGDIDADGAVTIADALMIFKYKSGEIKLSDTQLKAANTDKNEKVELADALRIFKFKSGEIDKL